MRICSGSALLWVCTAGSWAIINPNFTPKDLVAQSDLVLSVRLKPAGSPLEWTLVAEKSIKGVSQGENVASLAACSKDHLEDITQALKACAAEGRPAVLFAGGAGEEKRAYLHVGGQWLGVRATADRRWEITGPASQMSGTYEGGTDSLIRMAEYLAREPDAFVLVNAGIRWVSQTRVGRIEREGEAPAEPHPGKGWHGRSLALPGRSLAGEAGGLDAVEIGEPRRTHLFVASSAGDRLYAPRKDEDEFDDATARAGLDSRSRVFLWLDVNGDGLADLVTWDGSSVSVRLATREGTFRRDGGRGTGDAGKEGGRGEGRGTREDPEKKALDPRPSGLAPPASPLRPRPFPTAGPAWEFRPPAACIGLAACGRRGAPGVLVSTGGLPVLLAAGPGGWRAAALPDGPAAQESLGQHSPCIVADLDNDGFADVLLPAERGGILWRGTAAGFAPPVGTNVSTGGGRALAAVGDFGAHGALDIFLAGATRNSLWENDGRGGFADVLRTCGSLRLKCPTRALAVRAMDLNHDGRLDLALGYEAANFQYHFDRGFRTFGEEREVRLPGRDGSGQRAFAEADFNQDGSLDLAVLFTHGELTCYYNDRAESPGLRLRLPRGVTGPVTASCWLRPRDPMCTGTVSVTGHSPGSYVTVRSPGEVAIRYRLPGKPEQTQTVTVAGEPKEVILSEKGTE